jgi:hypothetical protein
MVVPLASAQQDDYFLKCNTFMLNGEYKHFISRTAQPVVSVSYFTSGSQNQYKILYNGSGGGLMMCIITITLSNYAIVLNAFVTIGITNIVDNCGQYTEQANCVECLIGWHLEGGQCYQNIGNCIAYKENICVQCFGFSILI